MIHFEYKVRRKNIITNQTRCTFLFITIQFFISGSSQRYQLPTQSRKSLPQSKVRRRAKCISKRKSPGKCKLMLTRTFEHLDQNYSNPISIISNQLSPRPCNLQSRPSSFLLSVMYLFNNIYRCQQARTTLMTRILTLPLFYINIFFIKNQATQQARRAGYPADIRGIFWIEWGILYLFQTHGASKYHLPFSLVHRELISITDRIHTLASELVLLAC